MQKSWKTKYSKKEKKIVYFMQFYSLSYTNIKPWCKAMNLAHFFLFFAHLNVKFSWICIQKILRTYFMPIIGIFCYFSDFWQFLAKLGCPRPYPPHWGQIEILVPKLGIFENRAIFPPFWLLFQAMKWYLPSYIHCHIFSFPMVCLEWVWVVHSQWYGQNRKKHPVFWFPPLCFAPV